ncbi:hypothetical protein Pla123a_03520 [Posidoniimonas polymericola]|uniref:PEP-CTERM protein-sorting domain-containing protein n=1 Tax=Posidoniimonas polymericola TaxID=2528002 RepID=A0A5C5ZEF9_9BACT|nr:hypothetical protein [Posidoniimonas polymericola]TWT85545.1 hypothetical protein Pla123a_03520 [Posidoniimonas polymericola]
MKTTLRLSAVLSLCLATASIAVQAPAAELLTAGGFEATVSGGEVPFWTLEEFISDGSMSPVGAAALVGFANDINDEEGGSGLWLQAFNGGDEARSFNGINAILSQVVAVSAGDSYTLTGASNFEQNYSGGVVSLDGLSPLGQQNGGVATPTPTQSFFEIEWLDGSGTPVGTPATLDLVNDDFQFSGGGWLSHTPLTATAPTGATQARISAKAIDMVENIDPGQSAFYDNFSFTNDSAPGTELLLNGNLNETPPTLEDVLSEIWEIVETPSDVNVLSYAGFANNGDTGGANGVWVRAFAGDGSNGVVQQSVEAMAGVEYTFNASSRFEVNFAADQGNGENQMLMELSFLDGSGTVIDTASYDLRVDGGQTSDNLWHDHSLSATAPAGTAQVRVAGVVNNIFNNPAGGAQSAFWDDFSLMTAIAGLAGDFNNDGMVDAADYTVWRDGFGTTYDQSDYDDWAANYGATSAPSAAAGAVPEPATGLCCLTAAALVVGLRRRRS